MIVEGLYGDDTGGAGRIPGGSGRGAVPLGDGIAGEERMAQVQALERRLSAQMQALEQRVVRYFIWIGGIQFALLLVILSVMWGVLWGR